MQVIPNQAKVAVVCAMTKLVLFSRDFGLANSLSRMFGFHTDRILARTKSTVYRAYQHNTLKRKKDLTLLTDEFKNCKLCS